jgi:hypothetical protein
MDMDVWDLDMDIEVFIGVVAVALPRIVCALISVERRCCLAILACLLEG